MSDVRGVGVDLCAIPRMEALLGSDRFLSRSFTPEEIAYIRSRGLMAGASMAGLWAAKEAAVKALGIGISLPLTEIEITHTPSGQPVYVLHGKALSLCQGGSMHLSISHEGEMVAAFCVWSV